MNLEAGVWLETSIGKAVVISNPDDKSDEVEVRHYVSTANTISATNKTLKIDSVDIWEPKRGNQCIFCDSRYPSVLVVMRYQGKERGHHVGEGKSGALANPRFDKVYPLEYVAIGGTGSW